MSARQRKLASNLLSAIGKVEWASDETLMDAVTALSGSGPAYVFLLAEAMASAGIAAGLPPALATRLAHDNRRGFRRIAASFAAQRRNLRENVTSPGGTTAAALDVLLGREVLRTDDKGHCRGHAQVTRSGGLGRALEPSPFRSYIYTDEFAMGGRHGPQVQAFTQKSGRNPGARGSDRDKAIDALMSLLADHSFEQVGLAEVAGKAGIKLSQLRAEFGSTLSILAAHIKEIDRVVLAGGDGDMAEESARERLFDVLMRRLEALAPYRDAVRSIMRSARRNPGLAFALNAMAVRSQRWMLEAAGIGTAGPRGALRAQGAALMFCTRAVRVDR